MYDRAPREILVRLEKSCWPGPGSYDVHLNSSFVEEPTDNIVPFLSTSCRGKKVCRDDSVGPASYKLRSGFGNKPGGRFWLSSSKRFKEASTRLLEKPKPEDALTDLGHQSFNRPFKPIGAVKPRIRKTKKRIKKPSLSIPSIPDRVSKYGYEYTKDGPICRLPPPTHDPTMGPAYYDVPSNDLSLTTELYKGHFWSRRTGDNRFFDPDSNPGPGDYNSHLASVRELFHFPQEPLKIPRFLEAVVCKGLKEDLPGPGAYSLTNPFAMSISDICRVKAPFLSSSERFPQKRQRSMPAPSSYDDPRKSISRACHFNQPDLAPFGTTGERFCVDKRQPISPAPNHYHLKGFAEENQTKNDYSKIIARSAAPGFGTRSDRPCHCQNMGPTSREVEIVEKETVPNTKPKPKLAPKRTCRRVPTKFTIPDPGDHDIAHVFDYLRRPTCHRRLAKGKTDRVAFLSASNRFPERKIKRPKKCPRLLSDGPGPGSYDIATKQSCRRKGIRFSGSDRFFIKRPLRWPTPATYKLAPSYHDTMLKGTFNATLDSILPQNFGDEWRPPHVDHFYCTQLLSSQIPDCTYRF